MLNILFGELLMRTLNYWGKIIPDQININSVWNIHDSCLKRWTCGTINTVINSRGAASLQVGEEETRRCWAPRARVGVHQRRLAVHTTCGTSKDALPPASERKRHWCLILCSHKANGAKRGINPAPLSDLIKTPFRLILFSKDLLYRSPLFGLSSRTLDCIHKIWKSGRNKPLL